jgi:hypothetical protein
LRMQARCKPTHAHTHQWDRSSEVVMRECLEAMVVRSQNPMCVIEVCVWACASLPPRVCVHAHARVPTCTQTGLDSVRVV